LPVLKWAGGKRGLLPKIQANLPQDFRSRRYHEPFLGGGAVFFWLKPKKGSINDVNRRLMNFYRVLRDEPEALISEAKRYLYSENAYYKLRERFNQKAITPIEEAALLLYFNKTAYNGLYRENSKGKFNVPFGSYENPTIVHEKRLHQASKVLQGIEIVNDDFSYVLNVARKGEGFETHALNCTGWA
jgi:DNA adenine methylase